jgi:hypothetical protein
MGVMEMPGIFEEWCARVVAFLDGLLMVFDEDGFPAIFQSLGWTFGIAVILEPTGRK